LVGGRANLRRTGIIVVTHDERMIAGFDTVRRMRDGRFVEAPDPHGGVTPMARDGAETVAHGAIGRD
jgi:ABC-type lipoprotein export system ATPase subunit